MHVCKFYIHFTIKIACMQQEDFLILQHLGNRIKTLRKQKKMTLCEMCYKNGLEPSTLSRIEQALVEPKYLTILKIAKALNISINELLVNE